MDNFTLLIINIVLLITFAVIVSLSETMGPSGKVSQAVFIFIQKRKDLFGHYRTLEDSDLPKIKDGIIEKLRSTEDDN